MQLFVGTRGSRIEKLNFSEFKRSTVSARRDLCVLPNRADIFERKKRREEDMRVTRSKKYSKISKYFFLFGCLRGVSDEDIDLG